MFNDHKIPNMFIKTYLLFCSIIFYSFLFYSCSIDSDPVQNRTLPTNVTKDIDSLTVWNGSTIYIIRKPDFKVNSNLFIQAGAIIKFDPAIGRQITVTENGTITAQGTETRSITFTSLYDQTNAKDNIKENMTRNPLQGDWDGITLHGTATSTFLICRFYYGGGNGLSTITLQNTNANISSCTFAYNDGGNLDNCLGVVNASAAGNTTLIRYNVFYSNNIPISINSNLKLDNTNTFHNLSLTNIKNKYNGIFVNVSNPVNTNVDWGEDEIAYVINGPKFEILSTASLMLGNFVVLKFVKNSQMVLDGGNSTLINNDGTGVFFTSIYDDNHKGDTNGDAAASKPSSGDWFGITGQDTTSFNDKNFLFTTLPK